MPDEEKNAAPTPPFKVVVNLRGDNAKPESFVYRDQRGIEHTARTKEGAVARALAVVFAKFRCLNLPSFFRVTLAKQGRVSGKRGTRTPAKSNSVRLILNAARDAGRTDRGEIYHLANGDFLRLFRPPTETGKDYVDVDVNQLSPAHVCIRWNGKAVTDAANLEILAQTIAAKANPPWELADYDFQGPEAERKPTGGESTGKSEAHCKTKQAQVLVREGKSDEGFKLMEEALELARQAKDDSEEVEILCGLALMSSERRHRGDRQRFLEAAEQKVSALKSAAAKVIFYRAKASTCQAARDLAGAEAAYSEALRICTTEPEDEKHNLATQGCIVRSSFVHLLCDLKRLDEARPLRDDCESYARSNPESEDGELLQVALMAGIHFEVTAENEDEAILRVAELERLASKSARLANRVASDLIETANHTSHDKAHRTALATAEAAVRIVPLLTKDKQHSFLLGALYTEAAVLARSKGNDALALQKAHAVNDACNQPDDNPIKQAARHLIAELRRSSGDSQTAVDIARQALAIATGGAEEVGMTKMALARALNDNGETEEALKESSEGWQLLRATRIPAEGSADVLSHILHYASLAGNEQAYAAALLELEAVPEVSESVKEDKTRAKTRAKAHIQLRERLVGFLREENPAILAGTTSAASFAEANAQVVKPLLELWSDLPNDGECLAGAYDIWGRGNLSRILLNAKAHGSNCFNVTLEVRTLDDVKRAVRVWGLYADFLVLLWKGPTGGGLAIVPFPADFESPGGWGYTVCVGDVIEFPGTKRQWHPAMAWTSLLPHDVVTFLVTEARPFLQSGRLIVVPAVGAGCLNPGHGPIEQLLAEAVNAIPSIRWKGIEGSPIGLVPYSPDAPLEVLADMAGNEESRLRKLRLLLLKRSRTLGSDGTTEIQARELALEIDDALRDLQETHKQLKRKRGVQSASEPLNGATARFKSNGRKLSDASPDSPFAALFLLQSLGYGWRVDSQEAISVPPRFEPGHGDVIGTWLAPPTPGWDIPTGFRM